jgi:hypothetical protein
MQKVYLPKEKASDYYQKQEDEQFLHFSLQGTLPAGQMLVLNTASGTFSYIFCNEDKQRLVLQQQFTSSELSLLLPLLKLFPHYCPYELMFASFYNGNVTDLVVEQCRRRLQEAFEAGTWDQEMKPIRNVLSRVRIKLRDFGMSVSSILETGYVLRVVSLPEVMVDLLNLDDQMRQ